jgi:hypothetical protein
MKKVVSVLIAIGISMGLASVTYAQEETTGGTRTPVINKRQRRQQKRIDQGVRSEELTKRETLRLEREQYGIQQEKKEAKSDGTVTKRERVGLHRELNQASRHIYRAKHNRRDRN